jgi:amino acid transporter
VNERLKKSVDLVADLSKQLITVSTGIVTVTLLFSKDLFGPKCIAVAAWIFFLLSTVCGLWALMALTGTLAPSDENPPTDEDFVIGGNVRHASAAQIITFGLAVILTMAYVVFAFSGPTPQAQTMGACDTAPCYCQHGTVTNKAGSPDQHGEDIQPKVSK